MSLSNLTPAILSSWAFAFFSVHDVVNILFKNHISTAWSFVNILPLCPALTQVTQPFSNQFVVLIMIMFHHNLHVKCLPFVQQTIDYSCCTRVGEEKKQRSSQVTIKMRNVMMQLRKCCNHPYLLEHPVDPKTGELALTQDVITVSGKMLVLDKMLAELKKRGHRVSLFTFRSSVMLYLQLCGQPGWGTSSSQGRCWNLLATNDSTVLCKLVSF